MTIEPGTQIGRYEIHRRLGRGGMGAVYVAFDPVLGRMAAIKVFSGDVDLSDARARFSREARAAAALSHPNVVTIYDFGEFDSQPYIVMEYVAGETLAQVIARGSGASILEKLRWIEELCAGAGYAHERSLVHRDLKPANLVIDRSRHLKILDFGIARMLGTASMTRSILGTPGYMAPEQFEGSGVNHLADVFSIGVVFYELLSGRAAFPGDSPAAISHRILTQDPVPLRDVAPDVPSGIAAVCERACRKAPSERFESATSMGAAVACIREALEIETSETLIAAVVPPVVQAPAGGHDASAGEQQAAPTTDWVPRPRTWRERAACLAARIRGVRPLRPAVVRRAPWLFAAGAASATLVTGAVVFPLGAAPTGTVPIEAIPWAAVTFIEQTRGGRLPLPSGPFTPVRLHLPPGEYRIGLVGPPPESRTETVRVRVESGATAAVPVTQFRAPTVEQYFNRYLEPLADVAPAAIDTAGPAGERR